MALQKISQRENEAGSAKENAIYAASALATVVVFVADSMTPLGITVWVFYLIPLMLCLGAWQPTAPWVAAFTSTVLLAVGYFVSPKGADMQVGALNRFMATATVWIVAFVISTSIRNKVKVRTQEWLQSARTGLSEQMAGDPSLSILGERTLTFLANYLNAHAAAFFVEEGGLFRRIAEYAVPANSGVPDVVKPGEGLLGQAAKDNRILSITDVPPDYFPMASGLGRAAPRHLLIAPVSGEETVNGLLEFAFFKPLNGNEAELLKRVSESITVAIRSAKYRARLQELLHETQSQAEELQAQSEELRVSNEELEEQSRALKESQTRLEVQQSELDQTNTHLEEQTQLLEAQKQDLGFAKIELENQAAALKRASQYKSDFLANMSHELRTPLNSTLILAKLLADNREGNLTSEQIKYAQTIHSAGNDLLSLITEILDLSKIEAGRMEIKAEQVKVADLLESLRRTFQPLAQHKGIGLEVQCRPDAPDSFTTDAQRIEQVLRNLLSNAVKFTEKGRVQLEVLPGSEDRIVFAVHDTGIGIADQQQEVIFEPFRQADGTTNRKYGGTGLGLSISRELTRLLGGEISLTSREGQGSLFTVSLPRDGARESGQTARLPPVLDPHPALADARQAGRIEPVLSKEQTKPAAQTRPSVADDRERLKPNSRTMLVIEDDIPFAKILSDLAHELSFQCLIATTAEEGLALAAQYRPDAVVLDVGLPDNSGLSVLDRLKAQPKTRHIPVHVISGTDYSQTALSLGAVGYMLKPVSRDQLVHAFEKLESNLAHRVRRVLVVEDDPVQLESVQHLLRSKEVETVGVRTAAECLDILKSKTIDCMVLDLSLPDASGLSLLHTLSQHDTYSFPPVIIYTGRDLSTREEELLRKYSKSIILKGARSPERLLDEVTLFLHQVVSELPAEQQKMLAAAHRRDAAIEGKRILVAEDDVRNVFALVSIVEPRGAEVVISRNGREAIEALDAAERANSRIDLVLMDIMMPEMDGLTAIREIRKRPRWKKLPIIALTAKAMKADQEQCLEAGANDYMAKPLDVEKLLSLIRVWMPR